MWFLSREAKSFQDDIILIPVTTTALVRGDGVELMMLMKLISLIVHK